jgi:hypothetical protein
MSVLLIDVTVTDPDGNIGLGSATVTVNDTPVAAEQPVDHFSMGAALPDFAERARQRWGQVR